MGSRWLPALVLVAWAAAAPPARADTHGDAEQVFRDGQALLKAGKVGEACTAFADSQRLDPNLATQMNLAACREKNRELASAWSLFLQVASAARADALYAAMADVAAARAAALEPRLSYLIVAVPADGHVDGLSITRNDEPIDPAVWNRSVAVDGGRYQIVARAPGHEPWSVVVEVAPEHDRRSLQVPLLPPMTEVAGSAERPTPADGLTRRRQVAVGVGVGALALAGGALALEWRGRGTYDDYEQTPAGADRDELFARANRDHHLAQGLAIAGVAAVGLAAALWFTGGRRVEGGTALGPMAVPGTAGLAVAGAF